jgi:hypothetical protein
MDMLEKRVKSRFTQNVIYLPHPRTFETYVQVIRATLIGGTERQWKKYQDSVDVFHAAGADN